MIEQMLFLFHLNQCSSTITASPIYLLIYLSRYLDQETAKGPSSQATTCCYQSNHSKREASH